MQKEIIGKIIFKSHVSESQADAFWNVFTFFVEKRNSFWGGGHDKFGLDFAISFSKSKLSYYEIKLELVNLVKQHPEIEQIIFGDFNANDKFEAKEIYPVN